ncbi:Ubiquitin thioesterase OTU1 [Orchesella cincta]|uniref:Ubiquitin thioesterase OTU1 n=1 Tax=Orchesella cincta TaxID=48709 RepID=A0A1D2MS66_ORCCI|nr:Ubiquitin thioesterase OTU1 [Orchesella cincta]
MASFFQADHNERIKGASARTANGDTVVCKRSKRRLPPIIKKDKGNWLPEADSWMVKRFGDINDNCFFTSIDGMAGCHMSGKPRTSTPSSTAKRFSEMLKENISPILPHQTVLSKPTKTLKKLGYPLLSSTKLSHAFNYDRLTTSAVHLCQDRLGFQFEADECEELQSWIFRRNAHQTSVTENSFLIEKLENTGEENPTN